ncbi:MAG: polysaccharide biosynthesis protein, partial [Clostridia bacterium]|nr:polysaccharide biosynthesis protein [Clostridia bacterium]
EDIRLSNLLLHIGLLLVCFFFMQLLFKTYDSLWRYAESREYLLLFSGMALGFLLYCILNLILETNRIWISQAVTGTALALLFMLLFRFSYRIHRRNVTGMDMNTDKKSIAIIGAGTAAAALAAELLSLPDARYHPYCFIDDDPAKKGKRIQGIRVYGPINDLEEILRDTPVTEIVVATLHLPLERRTEILNLCAKTNCRLRILDDPISQIQSGKPSDSNLRSVQIEDLLGRKQVELNNKRIADFVEDKTVLVTGGGGSIGSALCSQIAAYRPRRLVIVDIAENSAYDLQNELLHRYGKDFPLSVEIASVRDRNKIDRIFAAYRPQLVFHAAAHKHVPLMENCPEEAIKNNVFGTYNTAVAAKKYHAEKFVLISTDKAVNPTNIMGTTKNLCEQIIQSLRSEDGTRFAAVRFGNVLGSNGSVIPLFAKQIAHGGPVTITDKRIIRYFMTIPEAAQLVLEAGSFANSGEIYVLDMGEPVRILELAEKMILLSGYQPHTEIKIEEVGLRPGEKLYEELLTASADLDRTENEKIFVEKSAPVDPQAMAKKLEELAKAAENGDREEIFRLLHRMLPTFREPEIVNAEAIRAAGPV